MVVVIRAVAIPEAVVVVTRVGVADIRRAADSSSLSPRSTERRSPMM
jgi:hypothetical protein